MQIFTQIFRTLEEVIEQIVRFSYIDCVNKDICIIIVNINKKQVKNKLNIY